MDEKLPSRRLNLLACLLLIALVLSVYWQVSRFALVDLDDDLYIPHNPYVLIGLRPDTVRWAFTAVYEGLWQPMIWLSYMADTGLMRFLATLGIHLGPGGAGVYHLTNVLQHLASTLLLFLIFLKITGSRWRSAVAAAIFGIHPLNVESVAWVAERKNTLSTMFWMLAVLGYLNYAKRPGRMRYAIVIATFALGLMAKAVLVTLPVLFLLLDYWPLRRPMGQRLVLEKLPMLVLSAASGAMAFFAQRSAAFVAPDEVFPLGVRIANAFVSYVKYIWMMILPRNLSVCYTHPGHLIPHWQVALSVAFVLVVTAFVIRSARRAPYLTVGWLWYVITLLPVIGIVQVADQGLADRYMYVPMVGLLIMAACGIPRLLERAGGARLAPAVAVAACAVIALLALTAHKQAGYWRDSETMYRQVVKVNPRSRIGYSGLGTALASGGKSNEAQACLRKAIRISPRDVSSRINLGILLSTQGKLDEAVSYYDQALAIVPTEARANYNLAKVLVLQNKLKEAAEHYARAVESRPAFVEAHVGLANVLLLLGKTNEAIDQYRTAIKLNPNDAATHVCLAGVYDDNGRTADAVRHYREAVRLDPRRWDAANNLAWILATSTDPRCSDHNEAVRLAKASCDQAKQPQPSLFDTLAVAYASAGQYDKAVTAARHAVSLAESGKQPQLAKDVRARLRQYENRCPAKS